MAEKVTKMRLKVDLQCHKCYKKVKKLLCKFPQIRDQLYDEKHNIVTIAVVCCSPEKFRDKLCCKGCGVIKSIEIVEPPKPPPPPPPPKIVPTPETNHVPPPPVAACPLPPAPLPMVVPIRVCCGPCFGCYGWPPPCYYCYYGRPCYVSRCDEYFCEENSSACTFM